jgi:hypothetical protein
VRRSLTWRRGQLVDGYGSSSLVVLDCVLVLRNDAPVPETNANEKKKCINKGGKIGTGCHGRLEPRLGFDGPCIWTVTGQEVDFFFSFSDSFRDNFKLRFVFPFAV